jgi:hypothetical protein
MVIDRNFGNSASGGKQPEAIDDGLLPHLQSDSTWVNDVRPIDSIGFTQTAG